MSSLTRDKLMHLLKYDMSTGEFFWRVPRGAGTKAGDKAGHTASDGYTRISIEDKKYLAHRLAWFYMSGEWPAEEIDHRDGDKSNNKIDNLRCCSRKENMKNRRQFKLGPLGIKGVRETKAGNYQVRVDQEYLGTYKDLELAEFIAKEARHSWHGEFAQHG